MSHSGRGGEEVYRKSGLSAAVDKSPCVIPSGSEISSLQRKVSFPKGEEMQTLLFRLQEERTGLVSGRL